jgi:hypothetical protein
MPPKKFLKPKPKGKIKPPEPETENDFLEAQATPRKPFASSTERLTPTMKA